jgi:hypothetical protein
MKLPTLQRAQPVPLQAVSADAVVAAIGGTAEQLCDRFPEIAVDFMNRPMISAEHARQAYAEWEQKQSADMMLPIRFEAYLDDRKRRLYALQVAATAEARASFVGQHRGGQELERYLQNQWVAERKVIAEFEAAEPELTISEFRESEKSQ